MDIAILLYDRFTALDAVGPYEVLSRIPGAQVKFVATEAGPQRTDMGSLAITADYAISDVPAPEILLVPGGPGSDAAGDDPAVQQWIRQVHETTKWTTSVCTGSIILAAAGVLDGVDATTHWCAFERLESLGAKGAHERWVQRGKIITAAGVSAGIDMALHLVSIEAGDDLAQGIQLGIEYDPQPPFDAGSPEKAPEHIVEMIRSIVANREPAAS